MIGNETVSAQEFVRRSGPALSVDGKRFLFVGANAYYLPSAAAYGQSLSVQNVLSTARDLGLTVLRTWAFYDSPNTLDPAVLQVRPGVYNEAGLRALDHVIAVAKAEGIRLILPLVNNWDDYGGMNQYVRWRTEGPAGPAKATNPRFGEAELNRFIDNGEGERYRLAITATAGHDDFFNDPVIRSWYKQYVAMILQRVNTVTGIANKDEPTIIGWELANEPRSSDRSGETVRWWLAEMSAYVKALDPNHLIGSGEEGMDISPDSYAATRSLAPPWLFDGSSGVSFVRNTALPFLDFASFHLYSDSWNMTASGGNSWIREHARLAVAENKPVVLGEFGERGDKGQVFESWLTTALLDGVTGALAWQLLDSSRTDAEGFGFRCTEDPVCPVLQRSASLFAEKARTGMIPVAASLRVFQSYPNPLSGKATMTYELPWDASVTLELFDITGAKVLTAVRDVQAAGVRRELIDGKLLASGAYLYRVEAVSIATGERAVASGKLTVLH